MLTNRGAALSVLSTRNVRVKFTKRIVESAPVGARPSFLWDSEVVGFGLKVTKKGRRTYVLQYRLGRRTRRFSIGVHGSPWTVETARDRAKVLLGEVVVERDPQDARKAARAAWTVSELCEAYLTEGLATRKQSSIDSARSDFRNRVKSRAA